MSRVKGKIAFVTGGASGIGLAVARRLSVERATVIAADINEAAGARVQESDRELHVMRHDVLAESDWSSNLDRVLEQFGRLDILVNVAGITKVADIEQETLAEWQRLFDVNANGAFLACQYGVRTMRRCKSAGSIVIVSSPIAMRPTSYL